MALTWASALVACRQGHREGRSGGTMTPGPIEFRGPIRGPMDFRGLMEMTLTNQFVEHRRSFFLRFHQNPEEIVAFSSSFLEFTNRRCPIFELTPGPRLALGAPANN